VPQDYDPHAAGHELLESVRVLIERHSVAAELLVRSGDPAAEIERVADELRADAVVVGASMKAGHKLVGSVAVRLVRSAKWPVTVVP
jgi:nucleotide-binding universal stress UspA family protein